MRDTIVNLAPRRTFGQHAGLILQRYLSKAATGENGDPGERRSLFDAAISAVKNVHIRQLYEAAFQRWNQSFANESESVCRTLSTNGRLIVGLGSENVLETGIRLHHTYGVPIIPGSALKGLAAHYCRDVWGQRGSDSAGEDNVPYRQGGQFHDLVFGKTDDGGLIVFYDAWLTPESLADDTLRMDVMTPHHPQWQQNQAPPTDFDSPIPVSYLSVSGSFVIRLSWHGPGESDSSIARRWTEQTMTLLEEALANWGVGGKTSSGYGRLIVVNKTGIPTTSNAKATTASPPSKTLDLPRVNELVEATILERREKAGGKISCRAKHKATGISGPIQNSHEVPSEIEEGQSLQLYVAYANDREIAFKYPSPSVKANVEKLQSKQRSNQIRNRRR